MDSNSDRKSYPRKTRKANFMIVTMTLWIIIVTLSVLLVGLQMLTGIHIPQLMDSIRPLAFWTLLAQSVLIGIAFIAHQWRIRDHAD